MAILAAIDENERSKVVAKIASGFAESYEDTLVALHVVPREDFEAQRKSLQNIPEFQNYTIKQEMDSAERFVK